MWKLGSTTGFDNIDSSCCGNHVLCAQLETSYQKCKFGEHFLYWLYQQKPFFGIGIKSRAEEICMWVYHISLYINNSNSVKGMIEWSKIN